jgi:cation diffusion facilitator family transporter
VLLGVAGVALGWARADPIIGLVITVTILGVLRSAVRDVGGRLMDAVEPALVDRTKELVESVPGVTEVHSIRLRWTGHALHAQVAVGVDGALRLADSQSIAAAIRSALTTHVNRLDEVSVVVEPVVLLER